MCVSKGLSTFCLVRELETIDLNGEPVTNDYNCPLLSLTPRVVTINSHHVEKAVSIIHECNASCIFVECPSTHRVEREDIEVEKLTFQHDWTNSFYCLNIYCMN